MENNTTNTIAEAGFPQGKEITVFWRDGGSECWRGIEYYRVKDDNLIFDFIQERRGKRTYVEFYIPLHNVRMIKVQVA
jgi:hypothetical protein